MVLPSAGCAATPPSMGSGCAFSSAGSAVARSSKGSAALPPAVGVPPRPVSPGKPPDAEGSPMGRPEEPSEGVSEEVPIGTSRTSAASYVRERPSSSCASSADPEPSRTKGPGLSVVAS
jgi:hypothetical protein